MANIKLFGLVLIITTSILALAAISTQTSQIRIRSFSNTPSEANGPYSDANHFPEDYASPTYPNNPNVPLDTRGVPYQQATDDVQFVSISIVVPLCIAGFVGMLLWFTPTSVKPTSSARRKSSRKRK